MTDDTRHLSYLVCDLTDTSGRSDNPGELESYFAQIRRFRQLCEALIDQYQGFVQYSSGDGLRACFGYPAVQEQSAEAAVCCALSLSRAARELDQRLLLRAGIASGWCALGSPGGSSDDEAVFAVGGAVNAAARLHALAPPGQILVGAAIQDQLQGLVEFEPVTPQDLTRSGSAEAVYAVRGYGRYSSASQRQGVRPPPAMIGRAPQIERLWALWEAASSGGKTALVSGQPGIGKSTLLGHFRRGLEAQLSPRIVALYANRFRGGVAFDPLRRYLEQEVARYAGGDPVDGLTMWLRQFPEAMPFEHQLELLEILLGRRESAGRVPRVLQEELQAALVALFLAMAQRQPLLVLVEDWHWLDASSREFCRRLQAACKTTHMLILVASRPLRARTEALDGDEVIGLDPLDAASAQQLLDTLDEQGRLDAHSRALIRDKAGGVPLLLGELARATLAEPGKQNGGLVVPDTLRESYGARLETLAEGKPILAAMAVSAEAVPAVLLAEVLGRPPAEVEKLLEQWVAAGILCAEAPRDAPHYTFAHALLHDAAYQRLPERQRRQLHADLLAARIALDANYATRQPRQAAHHQAGAGHHAAATATLLQGATQRFAEAQFAEAQLLIEQALAGLDRLRPQTLRDGLALQLQTLLGLVLVEQRGVGDPEAHAAYAQAWDLCRRVENSNGAEFQAVWSIWANRVVVAQMAGAQEMIDTLHRIDRQHPSTSSSVLTHAAACFHKYVTADFDGFEPHLQQVLSQYDTAEHGQLGLSYSIDPKALSLCNSAHVLSIQGRGAEADQAREAAFAHLDSLGLDFMQPFIRIYGWAPRLYLGPAPEEMLRDVSANVALAQKLGNLFWACVGQLRLGEIYRGWGELPTALQHFESGLEMAGAFGLRYTIAYLRCQYAAVLTQLDRFAEAQPIFEEELLRTPESGIVCHLAEQHRLYAEALLRADPTQQEKAVHHLRLGLEIARSQGARTWIRKIHQTAADHDLPQWPDAAMPPLNATILQQLNAEQRSGIAARCVWETHPAGSTILSNQDDDDDVLFVQGGRARMLVVTENGRQVTYQDVWPGHVIGESGAVDGGTRAADVVALDDVTVARLGAGDFRALLSEQPSVGFALVSDLTTRLRDLSQRVLELSAKPVAERLAAYLRQLAVDQAGTQSEEVLLHSPPKHQEMADQIGCHREVVTRELRRLEEAGAIRRRGRELTVYPKRLRI